MFFLIGLGLGDAKDITVKGLQIVKRCDLVYLEAYTSILTVGKEILVIPTYFTNDLFTKAICTCFFLFEKTEQQSIFYSILKYNFSSFCRPKNWLPNLTLFLQIRYIHTILFICLQFYFCQFLFLGRVLWQAFDISRPRAM